MKEKAILLVCVLVAILCPAAIGKVIYVDDDAAGANDGTSWEDAYIYLQEALADANSAEKPVEIRVAQGIYKPDMGAGQTAGDRNASFILTSGLILTGGYAGILEPDPNERNYEKYQTFLSGDLVGNDIDVNNPYELLYEPTREDNSYHVITAFWPDSASLLDGFKILAGFAGGRISVGGGGGIRMDYGKFQICNCSFINNFGTEGAGICVNYGQLNLINCVFKTNAAQNGGGIYNSNSEIKLVNCYFENNIANSIGGGIYSEDSKINIENSIFIDNSASDGGAIYLHKCLKDSSFNNSLLVGNSAMNNGGAISMDQNEEAMEIKNFTFTGNSAIRGKAVFFTFCELKINNSILYNGGQDEIGIWNNRYRRIVVCYSNIQNGQAGIYDPQVKLVWGEGNIDTDPLFADPNNGDYHLKSQAGRYDSISQSQSCTASGAGWVIDSNTSPCIDAGDPNSPIGIEPFPNGGYINMGAYGGTAEASKSYFGQPVCETIIAGDINGDCKVDFKDFAILSDHWLK